MEKIDSSMDMSTEISCRACANICARGYSINSKLYNFSATIRDIIVLLVPQMEPGLDDNDVICKNCRKILLHCVRFIEKCLQVEADRKDNVLYQKSIEIDPITILEDGVIKEEVDNLSDVDQKDTNNSSLNEYSENCKENVQVMNIESDLIKELPSSILDHNRLIFAKKIRTDDLNGFIHILASNEVKTMRFSQDFEKTTEQKRVILIGSTYKCKMCYKYFDLRTNYTRHLRVHRRDEKKRVERERRKKFKIQKLEKRKAQKNAPERKLQKKTVVDLECKTCSEKLPSIEELELHLKIHPPYVCEKCGKGFAKRTQIYAHRAVHNERNSFVCEVCGKGLKTSSQLRQHVLTHENNAHPCKKCPKVFNGAIRLKNHMRNTHCEGQTRIWTCKECGKTFKRACLYQIHYRQIHLRDGNKKCDICGQGFYRSDYLTRHKRRHLVYGDTRVSLNNDSAKLQTNESVSNGSENVVGSKKRIRRLPPGPHQCQICMKFYKSVHNLKLHILSHGKARFSCKSCSRTFKIKFLLTRHERFHERSDLSVKYRCEICWKRFEIQEDLDQHYFTHSNFKYKCELCGESFAREYLFNDHMANVHTEDGEDEEEEMRKLMMAGLGTPLYNLINKI